MKLRFTKSTPGQIMMGVVLTSFIFIGVNSSRFTNQSFFPVQSKQVSNATLPISIPEYEYNDINLSLYEIEEGLIEQGSVLSEIFSSIGVGVNTLHKLLDAGKEVFEVRSLRDRKSVV